MKDRAISLNAAIEAIYSCAVGGKEYIENAPISDHFAEGLYEAVSAIEDLPSVTPQPKTGHWITDLPTVTEPYVCSECGHFYNLEDRNFCPNCGADMRGDDNERTGNK